jgi:hypothetical protein
MTVDDAESVYAAGWNEGALHDAICVCALFAFANRLVDGHGIMGKSEQMNAIMGNVLKSAGYANSLR